MTNLILRKLHRPLKVYRWQYYPPDRLNFGDELTPYIITKLFGYRTAWAEPAACELAGAGSIIDILQKESSGNDIQIWGSGFIRDGAANTKPNLHFAAVRGRLSLSRIDNQRAALGDPGLLMPLVFKPKTPKKYRLGVVPHDLDKDSRALQAFRSQQGVKIISVFDPLERVIADICSCELIVSSSLHGLIMSDAYNVPNYWLPLSKRLTGGDYKFRDYYSVFDAEPRPLRASDISQKSLGNLISRYQTISDLDVVQDALRASFPFQ